MARVTWTPLAESELENILFYIRVTDARPLTARHIGEGIVAAAERIAATPQSGSQHPVAPSGWLYVKYKRWLIFYQPRLDGIEVLRVIDAVRDLPKQL